MTKRLCHLKVYLMEHNTKKIFLVEKILNSLRHFKCNLIDVFKRELPAQPELNESSDKRNHVKVVFYSKKVMFGCKSRFF